MTKTRDKPTQLIVRSGLIFVDPFLITAFKKWAKKQQLDIEYLTADKDFDEYEEKIYVTQKVGYARKAKLLLEMAIIPDYWMPYANPFNQILKTDVNGQLVPNVVRVERSNRLQYTERLSTSELDSRLRSVIARAQVSPNGTSFVLADNEDPTNV